MVRIVAFIAACALLSACTTVGKIDAAVQKNLPEICSGAAVLHSSFIAVAATGAVPERTVQQESTAWGVLEGLCANPSSATTTTVLVAAANAYVVIVRAVNEAKRKT